MAHPPRRAIRRIDEAMRQEPESCILGILLEPTLGRTQPKAVTPGIHVGEEALAPETRDGVRQQHLEITDCILFRVVAAGIRMQARSPIRVHADPMPRLMQNRVQRRLGCRMQDVADQAGFRFTPIGAGNRPACVMKAEPQPETPEQGHDLRDLRTHGAERLDV